MVAKYLYVIMLSSILGMVQESIQNTSGCQDDHRKFRILRLTVNSRRNQTGDWTDSLTAQTTAANQSNSSDVDVIHTAEECQGNRLITIKGVYNGLPNALYTTNYNPLAKGTPNDFHMTDVNAPSKATAEGILDRRLRFHSKCGKSVILLNGGRTVQKILPGHEYTSVFTNRPLENNEIFQVKIEKKNGTGTAIAIGVIGQSPEETDIKSDMAYATTPYYFAVYHYRDNRLKGTTTTNGKVKNTDDISEGETLGVMKSEGGQIHLFYNGFIQDIPWKDAPSNVYGYFELRRNGYRASIVDP